MCFKDFQVVSGSPRKKGVSETCQGRFREFQKYSGVFSSVSEACQVIERDVRGFIEVFLIVTIRLRGFWRLFRSCQ